MVRFLDWQGFAEVRIRSHHVMQRGTAHTTVPVHGSKKLRIGTLRGTLRDIDMSSAEFTSHWTR